MKKPLAFISCSIRDEDRKFVNFIIKIVKMQNFQPFGTIGLLDAFPEEIPKSMVDNIEKADCLIVIATPRYLQTEIGKNSTKKTISENIVTEIGIASAHKIPVLAFVLKGTTVHNHLKNVTQIIEIDPYNKLDVRNKIPLINKYFNNTRNKIAGIWRSQGIDNVTKWSGIALGAVGVFTIFKYLFGTDDEYGDEEDES